MRWYEKNPELSEILNFIQTLDSEDRDVIAKHLLQIVVNECNIDLDEEISQISEKKYAYKRWYDGNMDLSTSLEFMKNLSKFQQDYVVKRFLSEIIMSYAKKEI